jgi:hypothetical protein
MVDPPVKKSFIRNDVEALFGGRGLSKCVRNIRAKNKKILSSRNGVENSGASLIDSISIHLVKYPGLAGAQRAITRATSLIPTVKGFYSVCPNCTKYCSIGVDACRVTKHSLRIVLIELHVFGRKPLIPIWLLDEFPMR